MTWWAAAGVVATAPGATATVVKARAGSVTLIVTSRDAAALPVSTPRWTRIPHVYSTTCQATVTLAVPVPCRTTSSVDASVSSTLTAPSTTSAPADDTV